MFQLTDNDGHVVSKNSTLDAQNQASIKNIIREMMFDFKPITRKKNIDIINSKKLSETELFLVGLTQFNDWKPSKIPDAPIQVIDFFSGCGGTSSGFAALGKAIGAFKLIGAVDINEMSLSSYSANYLVETRQMDIRKLAKSKKSVNQFLDGLIDYDRSKKTLLIGCAPCQGFSAHRKKNWDTVDDRNDLVERFSDIVSFMLPDCVVMENVPELISSERYKQHFDYLINELQASGYVVKYGIHNSADFGVPQGRMRAIIVAMKHEFDLPTPKLSTQEYLTVRDAIGDLEPVDAGQQSLSDKYHKSAQHRQSTIDVIKAVPKDGGNRPKNIGPNCLQKVKGFSDVYSRLAWNKPSITITHYARNPASGRFVHPEQDRGLTMREAARLQSFPNGYIFDGGFDDVFRQIGEAVPPLLSLALAASIYTQILT